MNFWDQTHPLSADSTRLCAELVPTVGKCDTLQGELLRASTRIAYDWYNNGWGCNNWSGAVAFLMRLPHWELSDKRTDEERAEFLSALQAAHQFSHGERVTIDDDEADQIVTTIHAFVVQNILDNPTPFANSIDMLDLTEPTAPRWGVEDRWDDEDDY